MNILQEKVKYISNLARLELTPEEVEEFSRQLSDILKYVEKIQALDTSSIPPTTHALQITNVLRDDKNTSSLPHDLVLGNACAKKRGFFKVPKVME